MSVRQGSNIIASSSTYHPNLFDYKWADHLLNDVQWLRADTYSWHDGGVYQRAYEHLVDDYNNTGEHLYGWSTDTFSKTPYPSVGDVLYRSDGTEWTTVAFVAEDYSYIIRSDGVAQLNRNTSIDTVLYETHTETIADTTIQYYQAVDGHKIVLPDQVSALDAIYNATGIAWYYILDTTNQRFKLPRTKFGFTGLRDNVGKYVDPGLPNITGGFRNDGNKNNNSGLVWGTSGAFSATSQSAIAVYTPSSTATVSTARISFDASNSNSIYGNGSTVQPPATQMYLYFYVGNFTQTAIQNTAGLNAELFNDKVDVGHEVIAFQAPTAQNNYTWYRKYKDNWVEQGRYVAQYNNATTQITLPITMATVSFSVIVSGTSATTYANLSTTGFELKTTSGSYCTWTVCGIAA